MKFNPPHKCMKLFERDRSSEYISLSEPNAQLRPQTSGVVTVLTTDVVLALGKNMVFKGDGRRKAMIVSTNGRYRFNKNRYVPKDHGRVQTYVTWTNAD